MAITEAQDAAPGRAKRISVPTLILQAGDDLIVSADAAETLRRTAAPARADFLETIANGLTASADQLIARTSQETRP